RSTRVNPREIERRQSGRHEARISHGRCCGMPRQTIRLDILLKNEETTMTHEWDELSKLLAEPVARRESMRRIGFALAGVVLSPLGLNSAFDGHKHSCKSFCKCSKRKLQRDCLATCRACNEETSRVCGACGSYSCANGGDPYNCG